MGTEMEEIPVIPILPHTIYELRPNAFGCEVKTFQLLK